MAPRPAPLGAVADDLQWPGRRNGVSGPMCRLRLVAAVAVLTERTGCLPVSLTALEPTPPILPLLPARVDAVIQRPQRFCIAAECIRMAVGRRGWFGSGISR